MLDSNVTFLFEYETKYLNCQVQINLERFSWVLSDEEEKNLRSKILTSSENNYGGRRYKIRVFTEQGIAMLATILKSRVAINVSIQIMDAFVAMRKYIGANPYEKRISNLEVKYIEHDNKFDEIFSRLESEKNNHIFFEVQIYDAYSLMVDILNQATSSIIVIYNYIDKKLLDILSKVKKNVEIIKSSINKQDLEKYNKQYKNIYITINKRFHDRFLILDEKKLYHCGSSFKDLGKKCFAINKIEDREYLEQILTSIKCAKRD